MKNKQNLHFLLFVTFYFFTGMILAQPPKGPWVISPQVNPDKTVTFRYLAPHAKIVKLSAQFEKEPIAMVKDSIGIWSVTTGQVKPDIYPYNFIVDSTSVADPANVLIFANERFKHSLVEIPGDKPLVHELQNVPHGKISYCTYKSATLGTFRPLLVYTPANFDASGKTKYPVLYLIHGGSDTEETWTKVGRASNIADNLMAQGKSKPMIIVMPYGNVRPKAMEDFTKDIVNDIIPFVEANYPVNVDSKSRAIAGFSVGGGQTLNIGLTNTDKFAYICSYAPYTATDEFKKNFTGWNPNAVLMNKQLKLFTISVGTDDFLFESVKQNIAMFKEKGLNVESNIVDGGHTWMNCRQYLAKTLQQLFQ